MTDRLKAKTALVTGGGQGIGEAICRAFAAQGARVAVADIDPAAADATVGVLPGDEGLAVEMDVASTDSVRKGVERAISCFGHLDILVNNAGFVTYTTVDDCSEEVWDRIFAVNLKGTFFCAQAAAGHMKDRGSGTIINMSSLAAKNGGLAAGPPYAAAKAGVLTLTITLARALAPHGIRVNGIAPGIIDTQMTRGLSPDHAELARQIPLGEKGTPEDVAHCALFLASEEARHITGEIIDVNGGLFMD
ncbi:MAG: SDR family NAD(P)-dependent oxidoreductase [Candidatus Latescibacterota bacterium]|nr:SDR family NAD(P)-dependent oxidoreductase [Candidatus Latescibacterota bacterium]